MKCLRCEKDFKDLKSHCKRKNPCKVTLLDVSYDEMLERYDELVASMEESLEGKVPFPERIEIIDSFMKEIIFGQHCIDNLLNDLRSKLYKQLQEDVVNKFATKESNFQVTANQNNI